MKPTDRVIGYSNGEDETSGGSGGGGGSGNSGNAPGVTGHEASFEAGPGPTYGYAYLDPPPFPPPQGIPVLHYEITTT